MDRVVVVKTEPKCKLCRSAERAAIDELLFKRSNRQTDDNGQKVNQEYVLRRLAELGVEKPTLENIKGHWKNHCSVISAEEQKKEEEVVDALREAALAIFERILGPDWREETPTADQVLEVQRALYLHELELRVAAGLPAGLTHDHVLKSIGEGTKRKTNEAQSRLLDALGGGIGMVFQKALGDAPAGELEQQNAIEGEFIVHEETVDVP